MIAAIGQRDLENPARSGIEGVNASAHAFRRKPTRPHFWVYERAIDHMRGRSDEAGGLSALCGSVAGDGSLVVVMLESPEGPGCGVLQR